MPERVIALDIGSTNVHAGLVDTVRGICLFRSDFTPAQMSARLSAFIDRIKADAPAIIGGGRTGLSQKAEKILIKKHCLSVIRLQWQARHARLPVSFNYKNLSALGADRIADALYAAIVYPKRNVIIIDSGTAVTVDAVSASGKFSGGVIMAGAVTHLRSLHTATDTLPLVTLRDNKIPFPGNSTASCMQAGAAYGIAGALNHLVRNYKNFLRGKCAVLATGGAWHLTRKLVDFECIEVPDMTLIGMGLYACYLKQSASPRR
jgi:type III pantothenate kinase